MALAISQKYSCELYQRDAAYQLGFCRIAGSGTEHGVVDLMMEAAEAGRQQAQAAALEIDLPSGVRQVVLWKQETVELCGQCSLAI